MSASGPQGNTPWKVQVVSGLSESSGQEIEEVLSGSDGLTMAEVVPAADAHASTPSILGGLGADSAETIDDVGCEGVEEGDGSKGSSKEVQKGEGGKGSSEGAQNADGDPASSEGIQNNDGGKASSKGVQKGDGGKASSEEVQNNDGDQASSEGVQNNHGGKGSSEGVQNNDGGVQNGNDMAGFAVGAPRFSAPAAEQGTDATMEARLAQASDMGRELIEQAMNTKDGIKGVHSSLETMLQEQFNVAMRTAPMPDVSESENEPEDVEVNENEPQDKVLEQCKDGGWKVSTECAVGRRYKRMLQKNHELWNEYSACSRRDKLEKIQKWVQQKWDSYAEPSGIKPVEHVKHLRV